jgi:ACS family hexuronate transporter-like MFS transporter
MGASQGLSTQQTLDMIQWIGGIPFLVGAIGGILTSAWSDNMIKRGLPALKARKRMMVIIAFIAPLCMLVPFIYSSSIGFGLKVGLVTGIFSLVAVMCLSWLYTLPVVLAETFPIGNVATVMGLSCGAGALGSVVFNLFTGSIPESSWKWLFILMGTLHLIAAIILTRMVRPEQPDNQIVSNE